MHQRVTCFIVFFILQLAVSPYSSGQALNFTWRSIASGCDSNLPVHGDFAATEILGGEGDFTSIDGLPVTSATAGNDLNFFFAHNNLGSPALTLSGFGPKGASGNVIVQEFAAAPGGFFHLMDGSDVVAIGRVLDVVIETPPSLISTGYGRLQLTSSSGNDPAIFNEIIAATGGTGVLSFSLSGFEFAGMSSNFPGLEFASVGCMAPETSGFSPATPLTPSQTNGGVSEFNIPDLPDGCFSYFSPSGFSPNSTNTNSSFDFCVQGNSVNSVVLPDVGAGVFDLFIFNGTDFVFNSQVVAGEEFSFPGNVQKFRVEVAGVNAPSDFIVAISFNGGGGTLTADPMTGLLPLRVLGTQAADDILVTQNGNQLLVNVNGVTTTHNLPTISRLEIFSFGGGDDIEVAAAVPTFISAGFGADEIRGGSLQNEIQGGPGPDVIYGGPLADNINAGRGQDTVFALGGDDIIIGGDAADTLLGGAGNDDIVGGLGADELNGGPGDDNLLGNTGADTLIGGGGNDVLSGQGGPDELLGGPGNDQLTGGEGFDILNGGTGVDEALDQGENEISVEN